MANTKVSTVNLKPITVSSDEYGTYTVGGSPTSAGQAMPKVSTKGL